MRPREGFWVKVSVAVLLVLDATPGAALAVTCLVPTDDYLPLGHKPSGGR